MNYQIIDLPAIIDQACFESYPHLVKDKTVYEPVRKRMFHELTRLHEIYLINIQSLSDGKTYFDARPFEELARYMASRMATREINKIIKGDKLRVSHNNKCRSVFNNAVSVKWKIGGGGVTLTATDSIGHTANVSELYEPWHENDIMGRIYNSELGFSEVTFIEGSKGFAESIFFAISLLPCPGGPRTISSAALFELVCPEYDWVRNNPVLLPGFGRRVADGRKKSYDKSAAVELACKLTGLESYKSRLLRIL